VKEDDTRKRIEVIFETPAFAEAVKKKKTTTVDDLIDIIMDTNLQSRNKVAAFKEKFMHFDTSKINQLSQKRSRTVLYAACREGCYEIVHILLNVGGVKCYGYQVQTGDNMSTCLHGANWGGHPEVVAQLLCKDCRPEKNIRDGTEESFPYEEENPYVSEDKRRSLRTLWENHKNRLRGGIESFLPHISDDSRDLSGRKKGDSLKNFKSETDFTRAAESSQQVTVGAYSGLSNIMGAYKSHGEGKVINAGKIEASPGMYSPMSILAEPVEEEAHPPAAEKPSAAPATQTVVADKDDASNLNYRFQNVASQLFGINSKEQEDIPEELRKLHIEFIQVSRDFLHVARTISKVIISEVYLPEQKKTIKPITGLGGVIGGQKFIVQNVLFKFAVGRPEMNVSNVVAAKIAGHELKSLSHLWECKIPDLCLPLQCLIDYLGFRMVAMLLLPINNSTLKVGSDDAGMSYHAASESLMKKFKRIGEVLNLAPHPLHGHTIYGPFDLEGHVGLDTKEYIIDFSRLFPPVPLHVNHPNGFLYRLFRPEFVKHYGNSLCSDGFTVVVAKHP